MTLDVQIFDTDCFGVMWHGAYTKWMEIGRVKLLESKEIKLSLPDDPNGYVYPVIEQSFRFKSPAKYGDKLLLETTLVVEGHKLLFDQVFTSQNTGKITLESHTVNLVVDMAWRVQRRLPPEILQKLGT